MAANAMAIASGAFRHCTLEQVLAIHARYTALLIEAKTIMSTSGEGKSSSKQMVADWEKALAECNARLDELGYGGGKVVRRVRSDFSRGVR